MFRTFAPFYYAYVKIFFTNGYMTVDSMCTLLTQYLDSNVQGGNIDDLCTPNITLSPFDSRLPLVDSHGANIILADGDDLKEIDYYKMVQLSTPVVLSSFVLEFLISGGTCDLEQFVAPDFCRAYDELRSPDERKAFLAECSKKLEWGYDATSSFLDDSSVF
jgi:hypothetical protein